MNERDEDTQDGFRAEIRFQEVAGDGEQASDISAIVLHPMGVTVSEIVIHGVVMKRLGDLVFPVRVPPVLEAKAVEIFDENRIALVIPVLGIDVDPFPGITHVDDM